MSLFYLPSKPFWRMSMALTVAEIDTAIQSILTNGQTVSVDGMSYSAANLKSLQDLRDQVQMEARNATRPTARGFNFRAMGY
jgi:phosphatidylserine decarboxylase